MEATIINELLDIIEKETTKLKDDTAVKGYEKASAEFEDLVRKGFVQKRGYNLLTIGDAHLHKVFFNTNKQ